MKQLLLCLIILTIAQLSHASVTINGGVDLGSFAPHDDLVTETFDDNFYFGGFMGIEGDNHLEMLVGLGRYADVSHHPDDVGLDATLRITPLMVDVCYNFFPYSDVRPYIGAGVGAYFYSFSDNVVGTMERGTEFGPNFMAGIKFHLTDHFFFKTQYVRHFIPPMPELMFSGPHNFNSSQFSISFGFTLDGPKRKRYVDRPSDFSSDTEVDADADNGDGAYPYSERQEEILVDIQQTDYKIEALKGVRKKHREELESLLKDAEKNKDKIDQLNTTLKNLEEEIEALETHREDLFGQWRSLAYDVQPVEEHIYYLERYHHLSPWDLKYGHGCFYYPLAKSRCDLPDYGLPYQTHRHPPVTIDDKRREAERKREHMERYKEREKKTQRFPETETSSPNDWPDTDDAVIREDPNRTKEKKNRTAPPVQSRQEKAKLKREHMQRYKDRRKENERTAPPARVDREKEKPLEPYKDSTECKGDACDSEDEKTSAPEEKKSRYKR